MSLVHLSQWLSDSLPGEKTYGSTTVFDLPATWALVDRGKPTQGQVFAHVQGRWDYGTTGPQTLGTTSLGSRDPNRQPLRPVHAGVPAPQPLLAAGQRGGGVGLSHRQDHAGRDALHFRPPRSPPPRSSRPPASARSPTRFPTRGWAPSAPGIINDRTRLLGLVSDSNADRTNFGAPGKGDFYKAVELGVKLWPRTENAGYSKLTFWHNDGTSDGDQSSNGNLGPEGWGFFLKHEQELTDDGKTVAVLKYGWSDNDSALYEQLAGAYLLLYEPTGPDPAGQRPPGRGVQLGGRHAGNVRDEYSLEAFYRFPLFPHVDVTLLYQSIWDPALDLGIDQANVFSLRIRTTF